MGSDNPVSLNYTIFFLFSQHFGTRGRQEHRLIRIEQLKRVCDVKNGQLIHIEWVEGPTKTRQVRLTSSFNHSEDIPHRRSPMLNYLV